MSPTLRAAVKAAACCIGSALLIELAKRVDDGTDCRLLVGLSESLRAEVIALASEDGP